MPQMAPLNTRLFLVLPREGCSLTVELNSLQVSEETTSSLIIKPGELQPGWYLFYGATWEAGLTWHWPCFLNRGKAFFPAPPYLPGRRERRWAWGGRGGRKALEIKSGNIPLLVLPAAWPATGTFSSWPSVFPCLKWGHWPLPWLCKQSCRITGS